MNTLLPSKECDCGARMVREKRRGNFRQFKVMSLLLAAQEAADKDKRKIRDFWARKDPFSSSADTRRKISHLSLSLSAKREIPGPISLTLRTLGFPIHKQEKANPFCPQYSFCSAVAVWTALLLLFAQERREEDWVGGGWGKSERFLVGVFRHAKNDAMTAGEMWETEWWKDFSFFPFLLGRIWHDVRHANEDGSPYKDFFDSPLICPVCFALGVGVTATAVQQKLVHKFGDSACASIIFVIFISASPIVRGRATVTRYERERTKMTQWPSPVGRSHYFTALEKAMPRIWNMKLGRGFTDIDALGTTMYLKPRKTVFQNNW